MREHTIEKPWFMEPAIIFVFGMVTLAVIGFYFLAVYAGEQQELGLAEIDRMSCGELKDFILNKGWKEYRARTSIIKSNAEHTYTWRCEK